MVFSEPVQLRHLRHARNIYRFGSLDVGPDLVLSLVSEKVGSTAPSRACFKSNLNGRLNLMSIPARQIRTSKNFHNLLKEKLVSNPRPSLHDRRKWILQKPGMLLPVMAAGAITDPLQIKVERSIAMQDGEPKRMDNHRLIRIFGHGQPPEVVADLSEELTYDRYATVLFDFDNCDLKDPSKAVAMLTKLNLAKPVVDALAAGGMDYVDLDTVPSNRSNWNGKPIRRVETYDFKAYDLFRTQDKSPLTNIRSWTIWLPNKQERDGTALQDGMCKRGVGLLGTQDAVHQPPQPSAIAFWRLPDEGYKVTSEGDWRPVVERFNRGGRGFCIKMSLGILDRIWATYANLCRAHMLLDALEPGATTPQGVAVE